MSNITIDQIAMVSIMENGADYACFVNGKYVISIDPDFDEPSSIVTDLADNLSSLSNTKIVEIEHHPNEGWNWTEVENNLKQQGSLIRV
jgi:hypothetical protein